MRAMWVALLSGCVGGQIGGAEFTAPEEEEEAEAGPPGTDTADDTATGGDSGDTAETAAPDLRPPGSCEPVLPDETTVEDHELDDPADGLFVWVCRGATVSARGREGAYFVDPGGELVLSNIDGRAWVRASGNVAIFSGPNEVWAEEGATVHVEAEDVTVNWCPTLTFSGGPEQGC